MDTRKEIVLFKNAIVILNDEGEIETVDIRDWVFGDVHVITQNLKKRYGDENVATTIFSPKFGYKEKEE